MPELIEDVTFTAPDRSTPDATASAARTSSAIHSHPESRALQFGFTACALGHVLVAASDRGIAAVLIGDDPIELERDLQKRFPRAGLVCGEETFSCMLEAVVRMIEMPKRIFALPLDINGTNFQKKVWAALRAIPPGQTASYADIAKRIGMPKAVRAVAGACAANPLAIIIPCHRVGRSNGDISGYRWGIERKRALLKLETEPARANFGKK